MDAQATAPLLRLFDGLADPRRHNVRHLFTDILTVAVLGIMCRADDWTDVVAWANAQHAWLKTFLELPHGIPCEDTFGRVFARIDPAGFEACFIRWTRDLAAATEGRLVPIDGKSLRRSFEHGWDKKQHDSCGQRLVRREPDGAGTDACETSNGGHGRIEKPAGCGSPMK